MRNPFAGRSFFATFGMVILAIAVLFAVDTFLANAARESARGQAAGLFQRGRALTMRGENTEAIGQLKEAVSMERGNREYQRALAEAQLAAGKTGEAESTLSNLLETDPTDGPSNLIMGRVLVKSARFEEAVSYFHRAIYGRWKDDSEGNRLRVRFELIDLLAQRNAKAELLAELLPVAESAPDDLKTRLRMGELFLLAGSPIRAADIYRGILRDAPENPDAHDGLGEAEFARSNYRAAQRDFQSALRFDPERQATRRLLELCDDLLRLDPTIRGIGPEERLRRSLELVRLTADEAGQCVGGNPPPEWAGLSEEVAKAMNARRRPGRNNESAEANVDLAERIWQVRRKNCQAPPAADSPLVLVLARLAQ